MKARSSGCRRRSRGCSAGSTSASGRSSSAASAWGAPASRRWNSSAASWASPRSACARSSPAPRKSSARSPARRSSTCRCSDWSVVGQKSLLAAHESRYDLIIEFPAPCVRRGPARAKRFFGAAGKGIATPLRRGILENFTVQVAGVAQSAEHRFCKPRVVSSSLTASSARPSGWRGALGCSDPRRRLGTGIDNESGLGRNGWIPKRPKGPDCKSGGNAFAGSNPAPPMSIPIGMESDSRSSTWVLNRGGQSHRNKMSNDGGRIDEDRWRFSPR